MLLIGREGALAPDPGALRPWFLTAPLAWQNQAYPARSLRSARAPRPPGQGSTHGASTRSAKNALAPVRHTSAKPSAGAGALRLNLSSQAPLCTPAVYFLPSLAASPGQTPAPRRSPAAAAPRGAPAKKERTPGTPPRARHRAPPRPPRPHVSEQEPPCPPRSSPTATGRTSDSEPGPLVRFL
jgi:hypothetical protein